MKDYLNDFLHATEEQKRLERPQVGKYQKCRKSTGLPPFDTFDTYPPGGTWNFFPLAPVPYCPPGEHVWHARSPRDHGILQCQFCPQCAWTQEQDPC